MNESTWPEVQTLALTMLAHVASKSDPQEPFEPSLALERQADEWCEAWLAAHDHPAPADPLLRRLVAARALGAATAAGWWAQLEGTKRLESEVGPLLQVLLCKLWRLQLRAMWQSAKGGGFFERS